jgi:hypothetical protein
MPEGVSSRSPDVTAQDYELDTLLESEQDEVGRRASISSQLKSTMGLDSEKTKPEEKRGDQMAFYAAMVSS